MDSRYIGNLFMIGFHGTRFTPEIRDLMDDLTPSGVILFSRNIEDPRQVATLNHDLQKHARTYLPEGLFIGVDQEGGRVRRLNEPFSEFPPARELAETKDPDTAVREFATRTAHELSIVGINLDFVPVLDAVDHAEHLGSSVIGDRSFGKDPKTVSRLGMIVVQAMRSEGVIPCCKHFPGHGGTSVDSHQLLPRDDRDAGTLEDLDLSPFRAAVRAEAEMIMTAHVQYPALDPHRPATLSPEIITGILRRDMQYDGVVITDDLDMGAVANIHSPDESVMMALAAGVDILLMCNDPSKAVAAHSRIVQAVKTGEISVRRVELSVARIKSLKSKFAQSMQPCDVDKASTYFRSRTNGGDQ